MLLRKDIEVVITALTRNQVCGNASWVRIPLFPPLVNNTNPETKTGVRIIFFSYSAASRPATKQAFCSEPFSRNNLSTASRPATKQAFCSEPFSR